MSKRNGIGVQYARALMGLPLLLMFLWSTRHALPEALTFFGLAAAYGFLLFRVVSSSVRAMYVMLAGSFLIRLTLFDVDDTVGFPAAGPWMVGLLCGLMAGGHIWFGPAAGTGFKLARKPGPDGSFSGGRTLAAINAVCIAILLGLAATVILTRSPTAGAAAATAAGTALGWVLFRFGTPIQARFLVLLATPLAFLVLGVVAGANGHGALVLVGAYGLLAGMLIGGRHWTGSRVGVPRPPFASGQKRRRRKRKRKRPASKAEAVKR